MAGLFANIDRKSAERAAQREVVRQQALVDAGLITTPGQQQGLTEAAIGGLLGGQSGPFARDLVDPTTGLTKPLDLQNPQRQASTLAAASQVPSLAGDTARQVEAIGPRGLLDFEQGQATAQQDRDFQSARLREKQLVNRLKEIDIAVAEGRMIAPLGAKEVLDLETTGVRLQEGDRSLRQASAIVDRFNDVQRAAPGALRGISEATAAQLIPLGQAIFDSGVLNEGEAERFEQMFFEGGLTAALATNDQTVLGKLDEWLSRVERARGNLRRQVDRGIAPGFDQSLFADLDINPELRSVEETLKANNIDPNDFEEVSQPIATPTLQRAIGGQPSIDFLSKIGGGLVDLAGNIGGR